MSYTRREFGRIALAGLPAAAVADRGEFPASIELEYRTPDGSDAVKQVRKCVDYCRAALTGTPTASR